MGTVCGVWRNSIRFQSGLLGKELAAFGHDWIAGRTSGLRRGAAYGTVVVCDKDAGCEDPKERAVRWWQRCGSSF
jgi:hypothetical protein